MVILTFISDEGVKIPHYTYYCLKSLRAYNPKTEIHFISNVGHGFEKVFEELNIKWFNSNYYDTYELSRFHNTCDLARHGTPNTKFPSPPKFFYRAMERIFYLQAHQEKLKIDKFFHLENDVLTYYPLSDLLIDQYFYGLVTPLGDGVDTLAFCFFRNNTLEYFSNKILKYIDMGEQNFCLKYKTDMFNEMSCLRAFIEDNNIISYFNTIPNSISISIKDMMVFDAGSYGQYLGGTNNEHGPGWYGEHHYVGRLIKNGLLNVYMKNKKPYVKKDNVERPLFNLHIHSKNLKDFCDV